MIPYGGGIGQEHEIKLAALSYARAVRSVAQAHSAVRRHARYKPAGRMIPDGVNGHAEDHMVLRSLLVSHCDNEYYNALVHKVRLSAAFERSGQEGRRTELQLDSELTPTNAGQGPMPK